MKTVKQLQKALNDGRNISDFCRKHGLPLRTVMRVKKGGQPRAGTQILIEGALDGEKK